MDAAGFNEMDANMFNQYMYKNEGENLDVSLTVPQYSTSNAQQQQQQSVNQSYHEMSDQTFHTPSFGDEEFDIPELHDSTPQQQHHQLDQYQMHNHQMGLMGDQQAAYGQHQWHHQQPSADSHIMANQTYQLQSPNHSNYHHMSSPNQQMLMMQQPTSQLQQHQPQIKPQTLNAGGTNYVGQSPQNGSTSDESDDPAAALNELHNAFKRPSPDPFAADGDSPKGSGAKKTKTAAVKKAAKKKKDPNEPQKPVSAYALFFRDTQAAIKGQNPNASFGEVSKIVASMWDVLQAEHKNVYKKKAEAAKKDYLKALAAYRASLVSQGNEESHSPPQQEAIQSNPQAIQIPPAVSPHQMQAYPQMTQTFQQSFVNQSMMNQNMMQSQSPMMNMNQQQNQYNMNQPIHQMNQSAPPQQNLQGQPMNNNNNQMPPSLNDSMTSAQNCIRIGCTNPAIVSNDWEDEYCSSECVITHCRSVFGNWVQGQTGTQQQNFPAVN